MNEQNGHFNVPHGKNAIFRFESFKATCSQQAIKDLFLFDRLYLNSRSEFNDPFDTCPSMTDTISRADVEAMWSRSLSRFSFNRKNRRAKLREVSKSIEGRAYDADAAFDRIINDELDKVGIKCFSADLENIPMWSHYADGHKGYCVRFKPARMSNLLPLMRVKYADTRPILRRQVVTVSADDEFQKSYGHALLTKARCWIEEKEVRLLKRATARSYLTFERDELDAVYFGAKACQSDTCQIADALRGRSISFFKMSLSEDSYSMKAIPISCL